MMCGTKPGFPRGSRSFFPLAYYIETNPLFYIIINVKLLNMTNTQTKAGTTYQQKMETIKTKIRRGDQVRIANSTGYSRGYVSEVLSGRYTNNAIVNYAFKITKPRKA